MLQPGWCPSQTRPKGSLQFCIISASGAISTPTLHQDGSSVGVVTYDGRFEIMCLFGSYMVLAVYDTHEMEDYAYCCLVLITGSSKGVLVESLQQLGLSR